MNDRMIEMSNVVLFLISFYVLLWTGLTVRFTVLWD